MEERSIYTYSLSSIMGVAVIYNTAIEESDTLITLNKSAFSLGETLDIILYDNSREPQNQKSLELFTNLRSTYYHDSTNPGVSKAYNYAAGEAAKMKKDFILLLDQDTRSPEEALERYLEAINAYPKQYLFCPILQTPRGIDSPTKYFFRRGAVWADVKPGIHSLKNRNVLNSGLLVNLQVFQLLGGYNEKIELYYSDFDFANRFRKKYQEMVVINLICFHSVADIEKPDVVSAISRFGHYVKGSYYSIFTYTDYIYLFITVMLRSVKLSFRYRNLKFLQLFFKQYLIEKRS